jgi:hypothetical protein
MERLTAHGRPAAARHPSLSNPVVVASNGLGAVEIHIHRIIPSRPTDPGYLSSFISSQIWPSLVSLSVRLPLAA